MFSVRGSTTPDNGRSLAISQPTPSKTRPGYRLHVRQAAELLCTTGDLRHTERETATAKEGRDAHQRVQQQWPAEVIREFPVRYSFREPGCTLRLGGRIDGVWEQDERIVIEEIKTLRHGLNELPPGLAARHRLQLILYAGLLLRKQDLPPHKGSGQDIAQPSLAPTDQWCLRLTYVDIRKDDLVAHQEETFTSETLTALTTPLFEALISYYVQLTEHRQRVAVYLEELAFPYPEFREGQRDAAALVYRTIASRPPHHQALVEAPTGSGKSLATLFPALKAVARQHVHQVMVVAAKNAGQLAALDALEKLKLQKSPLRVLQLSARDKICIQDSVCEWEECPRQSGFFERLPAALEEALQTPWLDAESLRALALRHTLCPHGLQSQLLLWVDVLVGDYNYAFSPQVRSEWLFKHNKVALLVDEAHNLPDRARELFSARLDNGQLRQVLASQTSPHTPLAKAARQLVRQVNDYQASAVATGEAPVFPASMQKALEAFTAATENWLQQPGDLLAGQAREIRQLILTAQQQAMQWQHIVSEYSADFVCLETMGSSRKTEKRLDLRCLSPAAMLQPSWKSVKAAILFSATLTPPDYFTDLLGLADGHRRLRLPSAFPTRNLGVFAVPFLDMRSRQRSLQVHPTAEMIHRCFQAKPGNYWVFTPSYEYQAELAAYVGEKYPELTIAVQPENPNAEQRQRFLQNFSEHSACLGFVVLGGMFGESIDLIGDRLVGSIILGPGLPQMHPINQAIAKYFESSGKDGFAYAYQLPGWQRVVQAAGRVIRSHSDRGVVLLVDSRFLNPAYRVLYPQHWRVARLSNLDALERELATFWQHQ